MLQHWIEERNCKSNSLAFTPQKYRRLRMELGIKSENVNLWSFVREIGKSLLANKFRIVAQCLIKLRLSDKWNCFR